MDRGDWWAAAPKVTKQLAMTVVTHTQAHTYVRGAQGAQTHKCIMREHQAVK